MSRTNGGDGLTEDIALLIYGDFPRARMKKTVINFNELNSTRKARLRRMAWKIRVMCMVEFSKNIR